MKSKATKEADNHPSHSWTFAKHPFQFTKCVYATISSALITTCWPILQIRKPNLTQSGEVICSRLLSQWEVDLRLDPRSPDPKSSISPLLDPGRSRGETEGRGSCVRSTCQPYQSIPWLSPPPIPAPYLEMGAGHTTSHLLEEGLLDLHKLGGLNDIQNLFHLPQKHHLGWG